MIFKSYFKAPVEDRLMNMKPLHVPFAKIERTKTQIQDLSKVIDAFISASAFERICRYDDIADEEIWSFKLGAPIPEDISIRVGEIFHNLRSSLDQLMVEVITKHDRRKENGIEFPFGRDKQAFEQALFRQKKRLPSAAVPILEHLKPYKGGNNLLWLVHEANRNDKHRIGLVPVNLKTGGQTSFLSTWGGVALVIGSRNGQHLIADRPSVETITKLSKSGRPLSIYSVCKVDTETGLPIANMVSHLKLVFENRGSGSVEQSYEFLTVTPGTTFKTDFEPTFDIAFGDVGVFEREPLSVVLNNARDAVERVLMTFERRFFKKAK